MVQGSNDAGGRGGAGRAGRGPARVGGVEQGGRGVPQPGWAAWARCCAVKCGSACSVGGRGLHTHGPVQPVEPAAGSTAKASRQVNIARLTGWPTRGLPGTPPPPSPQASSWAPCCRRSPSWLTSRRPTSQRVAPSTAARTSPTWPARWAPPAATPAVGRRAALPDVAWKGRGLRRLSQAPAVTKAAAESLHAPAAFWLRWRAGRRALVAREPPAQGHQQGPPSWFSGWLGTPAGRDKRSGGVLGPFPG